MYDVACVEHATCSQKQAVIYPINPSTVIKCPDCEKTYERNSKEWLITPFPSPFMKEGESACALIIKPSSGSFLNYKVGDDLHIGITSSQSKVYSFWTNGVEEDEMWVESVRICHFLPFYMNNLTIFNNDLLSFAQRAAKGKFKKDNYDESDLNCFDFVLEFLKFIEFRDDVTKEEFVEEFVQSKMEKVFRHCVLFKAIQESGFRLMRT